MTQLRPDFNCAYGLASGTVPGAVATGCLLRKPFDGTRSLPLPVPYRRSAAFPYAQYRTALYHPQIRNSKIEWPEGLETFRPFFFPGCDFTNEWSG